MKLFYLILKPILIQLLNSRHVKELVCELIDRYVKTTDNDIDDFIAHVVRKGLLKNVNN